MKPRTFFSAAMVCFILLTHFTACQPTPDAPIVNAGDDSILNERIDASAIPAPVGKDENLASIYNFPSSHKDEFTCIDTDVKFNIDANVIVPNVQAVPVVEVAPSTISKEMVKTFTEKMHPGLTFYDRKHILSKEDIEQRIASYQERASMPFDLFYKTYYIDNDEAVIDNEEAAREQYEIITYSYEKYKAMLPTAPEVVVQPPFDFEFHDLVGYYMANYPEIEMAGTFFPLYESSNRGRKFMKMTATLEDDSDTYEIAMKVIAYTYEVDASFEYYVGYPPVSQYANPVIDTTEARELTLSRQELIALGEKTIDCMGLSDDMALTGMMNGAKRCELIYHRGFNGLEASDVSIENDYAYVNGNEYVKITIQNDIVTNIIYEHPYVITKVENENVELVSFENAYAAFKKQAALEFTANYSNGETMDESGNIVEDAQRLKSYNINIDEIELVMVRIPIKNGQYRYVPAWQFRGDAELTYKDGRVQKANDLTFMTINAVDGTRIAGLED